MGNDEELSGRVEAILVALRNSIIASDEWKSADLTSLAKNIVFMVKYSGNESIVKHFGGSHEP